MEDFVLRVESFTVLGGGMTIKVTIHVGTDQNIEIEIFAEYKLII